MLFHLQTDVIKLFKHVDYLKETLKSTGNGSTSTITEAEVVDLKELFPTIPCQTVEQLEEFSTELKNNATARRQLFLGLKQIGGGDVGEIIRNMLARVLTNAVGKNYSYAGQGKDNLCFKSLEFVNMILNIVRTHEEYKGYTEDKFKRCVSDWLRNSDRRLQTELRIQSEEAEKEETPDYMEENTGA